jgi:glyoxylase-like metal-dependent hydrolase (beta-lactamase superfamily II)
VLCAGGGRLLFSGDHILNGSTTVIDPPDGNMIDYLDSLDRLDAMCAEHDIRFILPAHGYVLGFARQADRRSRPTAWRARPRCRHAHQARTAAFRTGCDCLCRPAPAVAVAQRSLLAHVERIRALCGRQ